MAALNFPTPLHKQAIDIIKNFFLEEDDVDTILLTNSLARGKGIAESDIDFAILIKQGIVPEEIKILESKWQYFFNSESTLLEYKASHRFAQIHLDVISGIYTPVIWDDGGGPDFFEVEIGNHLVYSAPLAGEGKYFIELRKKLLPYYDDSMQAVRLKMVREACLNDLDHIPFLVKRGLHFHAFDKLYKAFQEFLQALFIKYKTYPIAYNKWIREQVCEILKRPEVYEKLPQVIAVSSIESDELIAKGEMLSALLKEYC